MAMHRSNAARGGFTLIEVMIVIMLVAILATVIVSRLSGQGRRHFGLTVHRTGDLLMMLALREEFHRKPVGLFHDLDRNELVLMTLDAGAADLNDRAWIIDTTVRPVQLPESLFPEDLAVLVDGRPVDCTLWPLVTMPGQPRPAIDITIAWEDVEAVISLPGHAVAPTIRFSDMNDDSLVTRMPIDLEMYGGFAEW
jgi:prepilin-type N-terminal cleavage/methylation domain-containing protein